MPPRNVLVTGGSGFVGRTLCRDLLARGDRVRSLDLDPDGPPGVEQVVGDIRNADLVRRALEGIDLVIHAAAALPLWAPEDLESINVGGTRTVFECAAALGVPRAVHLSTTAVYGIPDRGPILETDPLSATDDYSRGKIGAEEAAVSVRGKVCVPVLRAKLVAGPGRLGIFDVIFDWVRRGKSVPLIGNGENRYQMLHVDDLSAAALTAADAPAAEADDVFNVAATRFGTVREDFQSLLDHAGFGRRVVCLPEWPVRTALRLLELLRLSPLSKSVYSAAGKTSFVSVDKIGRRLGWSPRKGNPEALADAYDWYLAHHAEFAGRHGVTHRSTLRQGALAVVRWFF